MLGYFDWLGCQEMRDDRADDDQEANYKDAASKQKNGGRA